MTHSLLQDWTTNEGFEHLFRHLYVPLHRYATGLLSDEMQAEEVVQDVFLKLWTQKDSINIATNMQAYLYRSVHNQAMNILNHEKVKAKFQIYAQTRTAQFADSPAQQVDAKELKARIAQALIKIPEKCRTIFHLSRQEELSYREIAEHLNLSIKTVENQMTKALKILRTELADYLPIVAVAFLLMLFI